MVAFDDLPNELIDNIVSHADDMDARTFSAISQTSLRLHLLVEPYMYEHVEIVMRNKNYTQFRAFVRTILAKPALRHRVRDLWLIWGNWSGRQELKHDVGAYPEPLDQYLGLPDDEESRPLAQGDLESILRMVRTRGDATVSQEVIAANRWAPLVVILLHHLPRLRFLSLDECRGVPHLIAAAAQGGIRGGIPQGLIALQDIEITTWFDQVPRLGKQDVASFINLPNLKSIRVSMDERNNAIEGGAIMFQPTRSPSINSLSLEDSPIGPEVVGWLLDQTRELNRFTLSLTPGLFGLNPWVIGQRLHTHRASLRVVRISLRGIRFRWPASPAGLACVRDFSVLETLDVPLSMLVGLPIFQPPPQNEDIFILIDLMPRSLRHLTISLQDGWTLGGLAVLLSLRKSWITWRQKRLPHLETFFVKCDEHRPPEPFMQQLRGLYASLGIAVIV